MLMPVDFHLRRCAKSKMLQRPPTFYLVVAWAVCSFQLLAAAGYRTHPSEVDALVAVKKKLVDPMNHLRNWNKGDPCTLNWTGVLCFNKVGSDGYLHVRELQLLNNNLSGTLAPDIGQLSHLEILDFMWNDLTGSIPKEIGNIAPLRLLLLNGNRLSGSLPDELGYLTNLNRLQIDQNYISGPIPMSFANLSSVKHLHLNNNSLSGQIPKQLSNLSTLIHLLTDNNNHTGYIPSEFASMPMLRILQLDNNNFEGSEIPASYGTFHTLVKLSLRNCSLQGSIPDFSSIRTLHFLDLSWNGLTGSLPSNLSDNMTHIDLSNNHLNGSIPASFSEFPNLQRLSLENNSLTGSVPIDIWQNLSFGANATLTLDLRNNRLSSTTGVLNPPVNVTLRLEGNPVCSNASISDVAQFCGSNSGNATDESKSSYMTTCPVQSCPLDNFYEYVAQPSDPCYCAAPLRIGYRLKSPSFSYFPPYISGFKKYVMDYLRMEEYQMLIDSYAWEAGPRLRMNLKLFPAWATAHSYKFNSTEVKRLRNIFASWNFPGSDLYGPYELLNFTLVGPYSQISLVNPSKSISRGALAAIVVGAVVCAVVVSAVISLLIVRRRDKHQRKLSSKRASSRVSMKLEGVKSFTFQELVLATNNFHSSTEVGKGGYGKVYRGTLADGTIVAIKRAAEGSLQGQKEFLTEIEMLSRLHHRNLVSLVGYCDEEDEQMLVYEFMPNGTLQDWIGGKSRGMLDFKARLRIAMDSAKGVLYLHTEANPPVFHRDIKSSNILLDPKLTAKVADFGLSRLAPVLDDHGDLPDHISTMVKGTPGYLDPEYMLTHKLTDKSDVYSLGIVFLELLTGMRPISHGKNIVREVLLAHKPGILFSIIDSKMGSYPAECVERFVALAIACCQDNPEKRPSMSEVVRELDNIVKMMPADSSASGTELSYSGSASHYQGSSGASTSGINVSGTDLSGSGLLLTTITPR